MNGRLLREETFEQLVDPRRSIPSAGMAYHGITPKMVSMQPTIAQVLQAFHAYAHDSVLVAHNAAFDMRFLQLKVAATSVVFEQPVLGTLLLSEVVHPNQASNRLEAIAERLNVPVLGRHTALGDALVTAEVFKKCCPCWHKWAFTRWARRVRRLRQLTARGSPIDAAGPGLSPVSMPAMHIRLFSFFLAALLGLGTPPLRAQVGEEVPFITTPDNVTLALLQLAGVRSSDHVIDLGSGDGRIVITAARRFGASGLGVEIVPELVRRSRESAQQAGVVQRVEFREQDLFKTDLSAASVITMYLLPEVNLQLRPALLQLAPGTRIVSHDWDMGDWLPDQTLTVAAPDKKIGREKISHLHRWVVPARAEGLWCGRGGAQLRVTQRYQVVQAQWRQGSSDRALHGMLEGRRLRLVGPAAIALQARVDDTQIVIESVLGAVPASQRTLQRTSTATCAA